MGRPPSRDRLSDQLSIKLPDDTKDKLTEEANNQGIYLSQLIRQILMDYVDYLDKRDKREFIVSEPSLQYSVPSLEEVFTSDEFRELLRKEVQLALKKLIQ